MKKKIIIAIFAVITAVFSLNIALAKDTINAYINDKRIVVDFSTVMSEASEKTPGIFVFYDREGTLCGVSLSNRTNDEYSAELINAFDNGGKVRIWIADKNSYNELYTLNITEKPTPTPTPIPTVTPTPAPTPVVASPEPTQDIMSEEEEYYEEDFYDGDADYDSNDNDEIQAETQICSIVIDCSTALSYEGLDENLISVVPEDGIMVPYTEIEITEEMTVYDVLIQVADANGITTEGDRNYVSGINGLSEFSCGPLSGWMYSVNGEFPRVPLGEYAVSENDEIAILYTCALGDDL